MRALLLVIVIAQSTVSASPQSRSSIEGIVVRVGTTDPISSVDLELIRIEGTKTFPLGERTPAGAFSPGAIPPLAAHPSDIFTTRTAGDGRFRFQDLPPGTYRLLAARPGGAYCPGEYGQNDFKKAGTNIVLLTEGDAFRGARIELTPTGTISGRIVDENGNPAGRVRVMAIESRWRNGKQELGLVQALYTDDLGEYRLFWLPPGRYYIAAKPEDLRRQNLALRLLPMDAEPTREVFPSATITHRLLATGETVAEIVEPIFYGGGVEIHGARAIDLIPGANVSGIDMALGAGRSRARTLRGVVLDATGKPFKSASVTAVPSVEGPSIVMPSVMSGADGSFELTIGPGPYTLRALRADGRRPGIQDALISAVSFGVGVPAGFVPIPASSNDIEKLTIALRDGINLSGRVIVEGPDVKGTEADNLGFQMRLLPDRNYFPPSTASTTIDSEFTVTDVQPGDYHMSISPIFNAYSGPLNTIRTTPAEPLQNYYVKSIRLGSLDVLNDGIHVATSVDGAFEIVLGANGGVIEGQVDDSDRGPVSNATVVLIPEGVSRVRTDLYKSVSSDGSGRFTLRGITPGDYRLFAWQRIEDGIWFDPDFIRANRNRGTAVSIREGRNSQVNLSVVRP